jgi:hypothetical protein
MTTSQPTFLYLDDSLVDETWVALKQDGIAQERVKEASAKLTAGGKFGLGKLWGWLASDLEVGVKAEALEGSSEKIVYPPFLRAILLPELILGVSSEIGPEHGVAREVQIGSFVNVGCSRSFLVQLPTLADNFRFQSVLAGADATDDGQGLFQTLEKLASLKNAFAMNRQFYDDDGELTLIGRLCDQLSNEMQNAMAMSEDDQVLLVSVEGDDAPRQIVFAILEKGSIRRHLAGFTGNRRIRIFGKIALRRPSADPRIDIIGVHAVSVVLD